MRPRNLILIGYMGVGKTSVARHLQDELKSYDYKEMDSLIESEQGQTISEIFKQRGESGFRAVEKELFNQLCEKEQQIISTGGGVILDPENRRTAKQRGVVCWLTASPEVIYERIKEEVHRPLLATCDSAEEWIETMNRMMEVRSPLYLETADFIINTDYYSITECAGEISMEYERLLECLR